MGSLINILASLVRSVSRFVPLLALAALPAGLLAQSAALPHHPTLWVNAANDAGPLPAGQLLDSFTIILARSPQQEQAFDQFLAEQQDPASTNFHRWLTPAEVGDRFGLSSQQIDAVSGWLQSQGLHVNWVSPSRIFIGFGGTAADLGRALHTEFHSYNVDGEVRIAAASAPRIPADLASSIQAIHGLYPIDDRPAYQASPGFSSTPLLNGNSGSHFIVPGDFATIYDLPYNLSGAGVTIAIVGRSRTDFADFDEFRQKTGSIFPDPTEVVPTAFGGVDPGPAYTAPPTSGASIGDQLEATIDVLRAGSTAPSANLLLVVASKASGGIEVDAQYIVNTTPVPAQIMSISFGTCESKAQQESYGVQYWDPIFKQAAAEGISTFVSSGDSGASGCDSHGGAPPASPLANSPNYICSSSYDTCVGGTEFNDTADPYAYWGSNNSNLSSALSYIPEGAWNEPLNSSTGATQVNASGGGVSLYVATPSWQTGVGVPSARAGRYTPDVAFTSAGHDGYFGCFAAQGWGCVPNSSGKYYFMYFYGTSAAAPGMAGITALLDQQMGTAQGNLNPGLYQLAASAPSAFHDATVATSGVASCSVNTPSMCNNSIASPSGLTGGQAGFLLTTGYDLITGLGSLDVSQFITAWAAATTAAPAASLSPTSLSFASTKLGATSAAQTVSLTNTGTATLSLTGITLSGANASSFSKTTTCAASLAVNATCTVSVVFKPKSAGALTATLSFADNAANSPQSVTLTGTGIGVPTARLSPARLSFASTKVGSSTAAQTVTLKNTGTATLNLTSITLSGANASSFTKTTTCAASLAVNATCAVSVSFAPAAAGALKATLSFTDNAANSPQSIALTGTGIGVPAASLSPARLSFASTKVGSATAAQTVTLKNTGTATLSLTSIKLSGTNPASFTKTTTCAASLAVNATCTVSVVFKPKSAGALTATLSFADNAANSPQSVALTGTGIGVPAASPSPASLSFPSTKAGSTSALQKVTLKNTGSAPLAITAINLDGVNPTSFLKTTSCKSSLAINATCTVSVVFKPKSTGAFKATLDFVDNAANSPQSVALSGTGK